MSARRRRLMRVIHPDAISDKCEFCISERSKQPRAITGNGIDDLMRIKASLCERHRADFEALMEGLDDE